MYSITGSLHVAHYLPRSSRLPVVQMSASGEIPLICLGYMFLTESGAFGGKPTHIHTANVLQCDWPESTQPPQWLLRCVFFFFFFLIVPTP